MRLYNRASTTIQSMTRGGLQSQAKDRGDYVEIIDEDSDSEEQLQLGKRKRILATLEPRASGSRRYLGITLSRDKSTLYSVEGDRRANEWRNELKPYVENGEFFR